MKMQIVKKTNKNSNPIRSNTEAFKGIPYKKCIQRNPI